VRGGLLDVFPPHLAEPVRIELDFETVVSVRTFDPDTQRSTETLDEVLLPPMAATPDTVGTREAALRVLTGYRTADDEPPLPRDLSLARKNDGLEELLPLLADEAVPVHVLTTRRASPWRWTTPTRWPRSCPAPRPPPPRLREGPEGGRSSSTCSGSRGDPDRLAESLREQTPRPLARRPSGEVLAWAPRPPPRSRTGCQRCRRRSRA
jgi:hypothetical protein